MLLLCGISLFFHSAMAEDDTSIVLREFKLPEYNKETDDLEYIIYGDEAQNVGVIINLKKLKVDWIGKNVNDIKGTVTTPKGVYDRSTKIIKGEDEVHFRSDSMDVDGVGFDADQKKQTIHIRSKVKVVLRGNLMTDGEKEGLKKQTAKDKIKDSK
ncbi:MAG: hypothetical protein A2X48_24095 [Lentisphaerae bacterium GWF2_49_21]|nr:MAG: hypothetical protein A2X48_24095 [Lentisphaerae bacterium GWF2_49_21]